RHPFKTLWQADLHESARARGCAQTSPARVTVLPGLGSWCARFADRPRRFRGEPQDWIRDLIEIVQGLRLDRHPVAWTAGGYRLHVARGFQARSFAQNLAFPRFLWPLFGNIPFQLHLG